MHPYGMLERGDGIFYRAMHPYGMLIACRKNPRCLHAAMKQRLGQPKNRHQRVSAHLSADSAKGRHTTHVSCDAGGNFYGENWYETTLGTARKNDNAEITMRKCRMQNAECRNDTTLGTARNEAQRATSPLSGDFAERCQPPHVSCDAGRIFAVGTGMKQPLGQSKKCLCSYLLIHSVFLIARLS